LTSERWSTILETNCDAIVREILGFSFVTPDLLIRALLRKAAYQHKDFPQEYKFCWYQNGLDTFGDKVLDFAIYDHFGDSFLQIKDLDKDTIKGHINGHREWYANNEILEDFALNCIGLQKYVIWGTDEFNKSIWNQETTKILADSFEALVGAVYKDRGLSQVHIMMDNIGYYEKIDQLHVLRGEKKIDFRIIENV
jgi:dsRNA-specific ribonuclease